MKRIAILFAIMVVFLVVFFAAGFVSTSFALPNDLILDTYLHPNDTNSGQINDDVIGLFSDFNFFGYRWAQDTLEIYTTWSYGLDGEHLNAYLGDVFFYSGDPSVTDGVFGALAVRNHDLTGEDDGLIAGDVFFPSSFRLSNAYFAIDASHYGDNEFVTASGTSRGNVAVSYILSEPNVYKISVDLGNTGWVGSMVRTQFTCANDVLASVPEPATMLLFGTGLIGMAAIGRKRFKKGNS